MIIQLVLATLCSLNILHAAAPAPTVVTKEMVLAAREKSKKEAPEVREALPDMPKVLVGLIAAYWNRPWSLGDVLLLRYAPPVTFPVSGAGLDLSGLGLENLDGCQKLTLPAKWTYAVNLSDNELTDISNEFMCLPIERINIANNYIDLVSTQILTRWISATQQMGWESNDEWTPVRMLDGREQQKIASAK